MEEIVQALNEMKMKSLVFKMLGILLKLVALMLLIGTSLKWYFCLVIFIVSIIISGKSEELKKQYKAEYKNNLVKKILETMFEDVEFKPDEGIERQFLYSLNLRDLGNSVSTYNYISAKYKGVPFAWSNVYAKEVIQKDDKVKEKQRFLGNYINFSFPKEFEGELQLHTFPESKLYKQLEKIQFEDVEFNKKIKTYASSQHDAFYLITPKWFERIMKLTENKVELDLCFKQGGIHTLVKDKDNYFEPKFFLKVDLEKAIKNVEQAVSDVKEYIDSLELDKLHR